MPEWIQSAIGVVVGGVIATLTQYLTYRWNIAASNKQATHTRLLEHYSSLMALAALDPERAKHQEAHINLWRPRDQPNEETQQRRRDWLINWNKLDRTRNTALRQLAKLDSQIAMLETDKQIRELIHAFREQQPCYALPFAGENNPELDAIFQQNVAKYQGTLDQLTKRIQLRYSA